MYYELGGYAVFFIAIFILVYAFLPSEKQVEAFKLSLPGGHLDNKKARVFEENSFVRVTYPFTLMFGAKVSKMRIPDKYIQMLTRRIESAGYPYGFTPYEYIGFTSMLSVLITLFAAFFNYSLTGGANPVWLVIALVVGNVFPYFFLANQSDMRKIAIYKDLPYKLDVLTMAVEAGMDFLSSIRRMVERDTTDSPLIEEFFQFLQEVRMGKTKRDALNDMARRADVEALNSVVSAIVQAEKMGTPVAQVLKVQAESLRIMRSQKAEKAAGEASVKIMFPLVFILFCTILILFGGIIVKWTRGELF